MMTAREKIGQRLVVGFSSTEVDDTLRSLICDYKISNIILFKHNIVSVAQLKKLCEDIQKLVIENTGHRAFISIDQEGGMVTRLSDDCLNIPGAMAISATQNKEYAYKCALLTGRQLLKLGVNFNLAPCVDVNSNINNPVIGVRSYADTGEGVAEFARETLKGYKDSHILCSAKHFPGHGDTSVDSHLGLPQVDKTFDELMKCEIIPFKALIDSGIPAVMTTHILFPQIEKNNVPATMSRTIITDILKNKLGFKGLVISDCMEMNAIKKFYGTVKGVESAMKAGVDLVFISHTAELAKEASDLLTEKLKNGEFDIAEMDNSISKILSVKDNLKDEDIDFDINLSKEYSKKVLKDSITQVGEKAEMPIITNKTVFIACNQFRATLASNEENEEFNFAKYMGKKFDTKSVVISPNPTVEEIEKVIQSVENFDNIVIATYNAHLNRGQLDLINRLYKINRNIMVIALRNPYDLKDLPKGIVKIVAYEYTENSFEVLYEILKDRETPKGLLPIKM